MSIYTLPWPPSVNHYWRSVAGKMLISREGRTYRKVVCDEVFLAREPQYRGKERLQVLISACAPDKRRRDLDNVLKSLLDALQHAGCYDDDSQIDSITISRVAQGEPGTVKVFVLPIDAGVP